MQTPRHPWDPSVKHHDPSSGSRGESDTVAPGRDTKPVISLVVYLACMGIGTCIVAAFITTSSGARYPYANDTAGYLEQATELIAGRVPMATPWGIRPYTVELAPSENHPPGYPSLIAIVAILFQLNPAAAALLVTRACWAASLPAIVYGLVPLLGLVPAIAVALLAMTSPSFYQFGSRALSDPPFFIFSTLSLACLFRSMSGGRRRFLPFLSGLLAGVAYAIRDSGIATLVGVGAGIILAVLVGLIPRRDGARTGGWWFAGAALGLLPTLTYSVMLFGTPMPYHVDPSATYPLVISARVYLSDLLLDLTAFKPVATIVWSKAGVILILVPLTAFFLVRLVKQLHEIPTYATTIAVILGCVITAGSAMVVIAHSFYELDPGYLIRHVMPYSWMVLTLAILAFPTAKYPHNNPWLIAFVAVLLTTRIAYAVTDLRKELRLQNVLTGHDDITVAVENVDQETLLTDALRLAVAEDHALSAAIRALPGNAFLVSNNGCLLRITTGRRVRTVELSTLADTDRFLAQIADALPHLPADRPVFAVVCLTNGIARGDNPRQWKRYLLEHLSPIMSDVTQTPTALLFTVHAGSKIRDRAANVSDPQEYSAPEQKP